MRLPPVAVKDVSLCLTDHHIVQIIICINAMSDHVTTAIQMRIVEQKHFTKYWVAAKQLQCINVFNPTNLVGPE